VSDQPGVEPVVDQARAELAAGRGPSPDWLARTGEAVARAVRGGAPVHGLTELATADPAWRAALDAFSAVLTASGGAPTAPDVPRLVPGSPAARLLRAVSGFPGSSAAELAGLCLLDADAFAAAGGELLTAGLVTDSRFDVPDCWVRTDRGRRALQLLG
jgi:hypothetical protein